MDYLCLSGGRGDPSKPDHGLFFNVSLDVPNDVLAAKDVPNMFIMCY
jgi:hypothetical protein